MPACFSDRGGDAQLMWGLMVCFLTFGAYSTFAPFIKHSDDQLAQLAQVQIFLNLVVSIGLRMNPDDQTLGAILTAILFFLPIFAIGTETPCVDELVRKPYYCIVGACSSRSKVGVQD